MARLTDLAFRSALTESLSSFPCIDEVRALPSWRVVLHADQQYYDPLRLPLDRPPLPGIAGYRQASLPATPQATGPRRLSPVPKTTIRTFNAQYAGGFLGARSRISGAFHGLRRPYTGSAPPLPAQRRLPDDARSGFTHVADRTVARPRFAPGLSTTHEGSATKDPGVSPDRTLTGRPP